MYRPNRIAWQLQVKFIRFRPTFALRLAHIRVRRKPEKEQEAPLLRRAQRVRRA